MFRECNSILSKEEYLIDKVHMLQITKRIHCLPNVCLHR